MSIKLKKEDLLNTVNDTKDVDISGFPKNISNDGIVTMTIRPLSDKELSQVEAKMLGSVSIDANKLNGGTASKFKKLKKEGLSNAQIAKQLKSIQGVSLDIQQFLTDAKEANYLKCSYGLTCDGNEWSIEDVGKLPKGVPDKISNEIDKLSDFEIDEENEEEVKN